MNRSIIGYQRYKNFTEADRDLINARPPPTAAAAIANSTEDEEAMTTDLCFTTTLMNLRQQQ